MTLADLPDREAVFVDANIFIYHFRPDPALGPVVAQVGRDRDPTHAVDQLRHLAERGQRLGHVAGLAAAEVAAERVAHVGAHAPLHQHARDMGSPERAVPGPAHDVLELDVDAEALQSLDHLFGAAPPGGAGRGEKLREPPMPRPQKQPEQVELPPRRLDAELAPRDDADPQPRSFPRRVLDAVGRIVIGQGDGREPSPLGPMRHFGRRVLTVGRRGVAVEVNARRRHSRAKSRPAGTRGTGPAAGGRTARRTQRPDCGSGPVRSG